MNLHRPWLKLLFLSAPVYCVSPGLAVESTLSVDGFYAMENRMLTCVPRDRQKIEYPKQAMYSGDDYIEPDLGYGNTNQSFLDQIRYEGFQLKFNRAKTRLFYKEISNQDDVKVHEYACINDSLYPDYVTCRDEYDADNLNARRAYQYNNDLYKFNLKNYRYEIVETQTWWSSNEVYADHGSTVFIEHGHCWQ